MVRTKADRIPRKAIGEKATAKKSAPAKVTTPKRNASSKGGKKHSGGNPYCPRETPKWQKSITCFINTPGATSEAIASEASSPKKDQDCDIKENIEDDGETD